MEIKENGVGDRGQKGWKKVKKGRSDWVGWATRVERERAEMRKKRREGILGLGLGEDSPPGQRREKKRQVGEKKDSRGWSGG